MAVVIRIRFLSFATGCEFMRSAYAIDLGIGIPRIASLCLGIYW